MKTSWIFGANELAEKLSYLITQSPNEREQREFAGFVVDDNFYSEESFCGYPVYRYSSVKEKYRANSDIYVCVGYKSMNENRKKVFRRLEDDGWNFATYIDPQATIRTDCIGKANLIFEGVRIDVGVKIGDANIFNAGTLIGHHSIIGSFNWFVHAGIAGNVRIGECCFFGMNSGVADGVHIADKTLVGGGCFMGSNVIASNTAYFAPKPLKMNNSELVMQYATSSKFYGHSE